MYLVLLVGGVVLLVSIAAARMAHGIGLPGLLLFLAVGVIVGEDVRGLEFGDAGLAQSLGTAALGVMLVEVDGGERAAVARRGAGPVGVAVSVVVTAAGCAGCWGGVDPGSAAGCDRRPDRCQGGLLGATRPAAAAEGDPIAGGGVRVQRCACGHPGAGLQLGGG